MKSRSRALVSLFIGLQFMGIACQAAANQPWRFGVSERFTFQSTHDGANLSTMPTWNPSVRISDRFDLRGQLGLTGMNSTAGNLLVTLAQVGFSYHSPKLRSFVPEVLVGTEIWSRPEGGVYPAGSVNLHYSLRLGEPGSILGALDSVMLGYNLVLVPSNEAHQATVGLRFALWPEPVSFRSTDEGLQKVAEVAAPEAPMAQEQNKSSVGLDSIVGEIKGLEFKPNTDEFLESSKETALAAIGQVASALKENPEARVEVQGHTDISGNAKKNQEISEKRALAVRRHLIEAGVEESRIEAKGYGSSMPRATNETAEGRAANRRVEIRFLPKP